MVQEVEEADFSIRKHQKVGVALEVKKDVAVDLEVENDATHNHHHRDLNKLVINLCHL